MDGGQQQPQHHRVVLRYQKKSKKKAPQPPIQQGSDTDGSEDSLSGDSQYHHRPSHERHKSVTKKGEWEILTGLKQGQRFEFSTSKFEGYLLKRRKWPLKGWHKRYFVLESSVLTYAKNVAELSRGKIHASMDIGMSVVSTKASRRRIDIDADASIVHLKCKSREIYLQWVEQLKQHRLRKQHQLLYSTPHPAGGAATGLLSPLSPSDDSPTEPLSTGAGGCASASSTLPAGSIPGSLPGTLGRDAKPYATGGPGSGTGTLRPWVLEKMNSEFAAAAHTLHQLSDLHQQLERQQQQQSATEPATSSLTKTRRKFRLRKHKTHKSSSRVSISQDNYAAAVSVGGLQYPSPPLHHQSSLHNPGDRSSSRSEDITTLHQQQQLLQQPSLNVIGGNLAELRPLSSSNPALSHSISQQLYTTTASTTPQPPSTPHFFPSSTGVTSFASTTTTTLQSTTPLKHQHSRQQSFSDVVSMTSPTSNSTISPSTIKLHHHQTAPPPPPPPPLHHTTTGSSSSSIHTVATSPKPHQQTTATTTTTTTTPISTDDCVDGAPEQPQTPQHLAIFHQAHSLPQLTPPSPHTKQGGAPQQTPQQTAPPTISLDSRFTLANGTNNCNTSSSSSVVSFGNNNNNNIDAVVTSAAVAAAALTTADDFVILAKDLLSQLSVMYAGLSLERDRLQQTAAADADAAVNPAAVVAALRGHLSQVAHQNSELRSRLARVHADSDVAGIGPLPALNIDALHKALVPSLSYESSSCFSASEYFDAPEGSRNAGTAGKGGSGPHRGGAGGGSDDEGNNSDSSSDRSTPASATTSDASDAATDAIACADIDDELSKCFTGRRTQLPVPQPSKEDFSLFNFLYKNIGKDLSKVSMPIIINEPLNMLQRLCEELEYSELLDKAASLRDPGERMIQIAAFAVSAYASSIHRAAHKPFNPLLGETYECIREDKGFKFVAEQVSHHPPISVCHAQGQNFTIWQDVRIKTKFWGKSLEFQPAGMIHLTLSQHSDVYEWNKVTSCVHNLFGGGTRWVDQYGEAVITNAPHNLTCKLTFVKASSWSSKRHEVFGTIVESDSGTVLHNLFGKWTEALYCGHAPSARVVWRPGSMPENSDLYYGFTLFAMELNELRPDQKRLLPPTDTRFRPDQKLLEEGRVDEAEAGKQTIELQQRDRRKSRDADGSSHVPMWFRKEECLEERAPGEEAWKFNGEYWNKRKEPGFANMSFEAIW